MRNRVLTLAWLVPRIRSAHRIAAGTVANFGFKSGTGIIALLVSFSIPKFAQKSPQMLANFGIGTLGTIAAGRDAHETSPPSLSPSRCGRRRTARPVAIFIRRNLA